MSPISSTRKIQTPFIGVLIFSERDENTRDVGLYRSKKADGSMPVCASKFCKVGEANPISSTRKIQTPFIGVLIFSERDENTRDVGLYRSKKADGSMPVCASKFCKVGEANPISSTKNQIALVAIFCGKSGPAGTDLPLPRHFVPPSRLAKGIDLCCWPFILVFLYQTLYNSRAMAGCHCGV